LSPEASGNRAIKGLITIRASLPAASRPPRRRTERRFMGAEQVCEQPANLLVNGQAYRVHLAATSHWRCQCCGVVYGDGEAADTDRGVPHVPI
jgi:hypothetical protein